jgi:hypothetical protein
MIALIKKAKMKFRLYAARMRCMYRDAARLDIAAVEAKRRPEQHDRAAHDEDNDDEDDENENDDEDDGNENNDDRDNDRENMDVESVVDVVDADVVEGEVAEGEGWPGCEKKKYARLSKVALPLADIIILY